ncbi:hypothetical protein [Pedobacter sp. UC225_65]|uniref:hypothetical protein n=1 Tax=Pedobacter sp. UC225_65 TaxID=3350173 RepID=UPI00366DABB4
MIKRLTLILTLATFFIQAGAQTLKPDVLVIGNGNAAVAAGLQSAISGVKTTILLQAGGFDISPISGNLSSGIEATFLKKSEKPNRSKTVPKHLSLTNRWQMMS